MTAAVDRAGPGAKGDRTDLRALLGGGSLLTVATVLSNSGNYGLNLFLGRWMTPADFADANLMVTVMFVMMACAVALQLVTSRWVSTHRGLGDEAGGTAMAGWLDRRAMAIGVLLAAAVGGPAPLWSSLFQTRSPAPFIVLAIGIPFFLSQALRRGVLQGRLAFAPLALSYVAEMIIRVGVALVLVRLGYGATGATIGLTVSFITTWLFLRHLQPLPGTSSPSRRELSALFVYLGPVLALVAGQIVINNGDILIVKSSFSPAAAGIYSAVALIGRGVFFLSWSVVSTVFPAATQRHASGADSADILTGAVSLVTISGLALTALAAIFGDQMLRSLLGPAYGGLQDLLARYALATTIFAATNVIASYHLSLGHRREVAIVALGACLQTGLLVFNHGSASEVISMQLLAMTSTLSVIAASVVLRRMTADVAGGPALAIPGVLAVPRSEVR